jgi:hypothetical protein
MQFFQLLILAIVAMAALAVLRVVRVNAKRTPLPEVRGRSLLLLAFVLVPPIAFGGVAAVPIYLLVLAFVVILMWVAAVVVDRMPQTRNLQLARIALVGGESDPSDRVETPVTPALTESIGRVTTANAAFPRGIAFAGQIDRSGFRDDWDALDAATKTLEVRIAEDHRLGLGVAAAATELAGDARSRLDTLRRFAGDHGQAWALATA